MSPPAASPAVRLSTDGVTYGAPGVKIQVAPGAQFYAKLDSIANVNETTWEVATTDGSSLPSAYTITPNGGVVGEKVTLVAGGPGTAGILRPTINAGRGPYGNVDLKVTQSTIKWWVAASNGREAGCVNEGFESDPVNGTASLINAAIRGDSPGGSAGSPQSVATGTVTLASASSVAGKLVRMRLSLSATIHVPALGYYTFASHDLVVAILNGGLATIADTNDSAPGTFMGSPFGVSTGGSFEGISLAIVGSVISVTLDPIDLVTAYTGTTMASGAWVQDKAVAGSVQGSGTALGVGLDNTVLSAGGHWYFYTAGTTSNAGSGPTHTSGSAADGGATAYYGGTVAAGVPMVVTVTSKVLDTA